MAYSAEPNETSSGVKQSAKLHVSSRTILALLLLTVVIAFFYYRFPRMARGSDFPDFYVAAEMVRHGHGHEIYNFAVQQDSQSKYAGRIGTYYVHPPFEILLFWPLAFLPLREAYLAWCLVNAALLIALAEWTSAIIAGRWNWQIVLGVFFLFPPILLNLLQGQDSILLMFVIAAAWTLLHRKHDAYGGVLLACGLFKFHFILPIAAVGAVIRGRRFLKGFVGAASVFLLISAWISGWSWFVRYPRFLWELSSRPLGGVHPRQMANLRGLASLWWNRSLPILIVASLLLFGILLWSAVRSLKGNNDETQFLILGNAVTAALLLGYHTSPHDLVLLLLPMAGWGQYLRTHRKISQPMKIFLSAILVLIFLPPLHLLFLNWHSYAYMGLPVLALFLATSVEIERARSIPALE